MLEPNLTSKAAAGREGAKLIQDGMRVGLGTGSTAVYLIQALAERCKNGLQIQAIASSQQSHQLAMELGIPLLPECEVSRLDITVDGADEVDRAKQLIKGGGGALLREKILASISDEMVVIVDQTKVVERLGRFPLAVEITPFCHTATLQRLTDLGLINRLRTDSEGQVFITDNGNYIADCDLTPFSDRLDEIDAQLHHTPGVVETGLFLGLAGRMLIGYPDGRVEIW